jgi:histidine triad (HIT) family protein
VAPTLKQRATNGGQVIICPIAHVTSLHQMKPVLLHELFDVVARVTSAVPVAFGAVGTTVLNNSNAPDQNLAHVHVHVIPRFAGDHLVIPDARNATASRDQRLELAEKLREALR